MLRVQRPWQPGLNAQRGVDARERMILPSGQQACLSVCGQWAVKFEDTTWNLHTESARSGR